jgi:hypothetical protein
MNISSKIGFGKKVSGEIVLFGGRGKEVASRELTTEIFGKIVVFLNYVPKEFVEKASFLGAIGIVLPSMHFRDYDYFLKTGDFSLIILMKFGRMDVPEELISKLDRLSGKQGELDGERHEFKID